MPQIGWFELLIVVLVAILVIGPKDFPIVLKKVGTWIGTTKRYFSDIQNKVNQSIDEEDTVEKKYSKENEKNSDEQK
jgi:sec-independent protein translocase protein TatB